MLIWGHAFFTDLFVCVLRRHLFSFREFNKKPMQWTRNSDSVLFQLLMNMLSDIYWFRNFLNCSWRSHKITFILLRYYIFLKHRYKNLNINWNNSYLCIFLVRYHSLQYRITYSTPRSIKKNYSFFFKLIYETNVLNVNLRMCWRRFVRNFMMWHK